jgi:hypothetical protein
VVIRMDTRKAWKARAAGYETVPTDAQDGSRLDAIIRHHEAQIVKCQQQIEKSDEKILFSLHWLAAYHNSKGKRASWGWSLPLFMRTAPLITCPRVSRLLKRSGG